MHTNRSAERSEAEGAEKAPDVGDQMNVGDRDLASQDQMNVGDRDLTSQDKKNVSDGDLDDDELFGKSQMDDMVGAQARSLCYLFACVQLGIVILACRHKFFRHLLELGLSMMACLSVIL